MTSGDLFLMGESRGLIQSDLRYTLSPAPVPSMPQHTHSRTPSLAVIVMHTLSEHCLALSLLLEFQSTTRKAPALLSLVARAHIQQAQPGNPVGRHA